MLKNLPKEYKDLFLRLSEKEGFVGFEDDITVTDSGLVYGNPRVIFDSFEHMTSKSLDEIILDLLDLNSKNGNEDSCYLHFIEISRAEEYINKEDFINALL